MRIHCETRDQLERENGGREKKGKHNNCLYLAFGGAVLQLTPPIFNQIVSSDVLNNVFFFHL